MLCFVSFVIRCPCLHFLHRAVCTPDRFKLLSLQMAQEEGLLPLSLRDSRLRFHSHGAFPDRHGDGLHNEEEGPVIK